MLKRGTPFVKHYRMVSGSSSLLRSHHRRKDNYCFCDCLGFVTKSTVVRIQSDSDQCSYHDGRVLKPSSCDHRSFSRSCGHPRRCTTGPRPLPSALGRARGRPCRPMHGPHGLHHRRDPVCRTRPKRRTQYRCDRVPRYLAAKIPIPQADPAAGLGQRAASQCSGSTATVDGDLKSIADHSHPDVAEPSKTFDQDC